MSLLLVLLCLAAAPGAAHAHQGTQGPSLQAHALADVPRPGVAQSTLPALTGPRLRGWLDDGTHVEIESFAGSIVSVLTTDPVTRTERCASSHPETLQGLRWTETACTDATSCTPVHYRIAAIEVDTSRNTMARYSDNDDVWLYRVEHSTRAAPAEDDWHNACRADGAEPGQGLFVNGQWHTGGEQTRAGYTFSCNRGVIAKCVRQWGYKPWRTLPAGNAGQQVSLRPLHDACVRAARADYLGDGRSHTRAGVTIDMFDVYHFNTHAPAAGFTPESSFAERGAVRVHRPRLVARASHLSVALTSSRPPLVHVWSAPPAAHQAM